MKAVKDENHVMQCIEFNVGILFHSLINTTNQMVN